MASKLKDAAGNPIWPLADFTAFLDHDDERVLMALRFQVSPSSHAESSSPLYSLTVEQAARLARALQARVIDLRRSPSIRSKVRQSV